MSLGLHDIGVLAGYVGATLGAAMVIPQIIKVVENRKLPGVSASAWSLMGLGCFTWLLYGIRSGEIPQIAGNVVIVSGAVAIALLVPNGTPARIRAARLAAAMLTATLVAAVAPVTVLGLIAFAITGISSWPQVYASCTRPAGLPSAVSMGAWLLRCVSQLSWLFYAIVIRDLSVTISACTLLSSAILVLAFERRHSHAPLPHPEPARVDVFSDGSSS